MTIKLTTKINNRIRKKSLVRKKKDAKILKSRPYELLIRSLATGISMDLISENDGYRLNYFIDHSRKVFANKILRSRSFRDELELFYCETKSRLPNHLYLRLINAATSYLEKIGTITFTKK